MAGRCECCDARLSYKESATRFVTAPDEPRRYPNMCSKCLPFLGVPLIVPNIEEGEDETFEDAVVDFHGEEDEDGYGED